MKQSIIIFIFICTIYSFSHANINAAADIGVVVDTSSQRFPDAVTSEDGSVITIWTDERNGNIDLYAQRLAKDGTPLWMENGIPVCTQPDDQNGFDSRPHLVADGLGGAIIVWADERAGAFQDDIYIQRINKNGQIMWASNGVAVCTASEIQSIPQIISDGSGGAIVTWEDYRSSSTSTDIYSQRVASDGTMLWQEDGLLICSAPYPQRGPLIVEDGWGGAIIAWDDLRSPGIPQYDIYAQHVNSDGLLTWVNDGVPVTRASSHQYLTDMIPDGNGGAILTWHDQRSGSIVEYDIYSQRINRLGEPLWTTNGLPVCTAEGNQSIPVIAGDANGGAVIVWPDARNGDEEMDIYAQHISGNGIAQWTANGVAICSESGVQNTPAVLDLGNGYVGCVWVDQRPAAAGCYSSIINAAGTFPWPVNGRAVSTAGIVSLNPLMVSNAGSGYTYIWEDFRNGNYDIYARQIADTLHLQPYIRFVNLCPDPAFNAFDFSAGDSVFNRLADNLKFGTASPFVPVDTNTTIWVLPDTGNVLASALKSFSGMHFKPGKNYLAYLVGLVDTESFAINPEGLPSGLQLIIKELSPDSTVYGNPALQTLQSLFIHGVSDAAKIAVHIELADTTIILGPFSFGDLSSLLQIPPDYIGMATITVYAYGTTHILAQFTLDLSNYVSDVLPLLFSGFVDPAANKNGPAAALSIVSSTGTSVTSVSTKEKTLRAPDYFRLQQNYPNPFNPSTIIQYRISANGQAAVNVRLTVFDVLGREVSTLVNKKQYPGEYKVTFNSANLASGVYFYQLQAGNFLQSRKMLLIR